MADPMDRRKQWTRKSWLACKILLDRRSRLGRRSPKVAITDGLPAPKRLQEPMGSPEAVGPPHPTKLSGKMGRRSRLVALPDPRGPPEPMHCRSPPNSDPSQEHRDPTFADPTEWGVSK